MAQNDLVIVVPFFEGHGHLEKLLDSINRFSSVKKVVIVDDHSITPISTGFRLHDDLQLLIARPTTKGFFTGAVNYGINLCERPDGSFPDILILNQDTYFTNSLPFIDLIPKYAHLYDIFGERNQGSSLSFPDGYIHGTFMYISGRAIKELGYLDAENFPLWGSTADYQVRAHRAGLPTASIATIPGFRHKRAPGNQFGSSITEFMESHKLKPGQAEFQHLVQVPPLVSVIVPCYNYGEYLHDCLASLLGGKTPRGDHPGQTFKSFEIIIVDDCSTDDSWKVTQSYENPSQLIRAYQTPENSGTSVTVDYGIKRSTGRYITFLSADDMRAPNALQTLYDACLEHPHHFAYDDIIVWNTAEEKEDLNWLMPDEPDLKRIRNRNNIHAGIMYSRYDYEKVGGYAPIMGRGREDWAINIAFLTNDVCGIHVPNLGYIYRRHGANRTLSNSWVPQRVENLANLKKLYPSAYDDKKVEMMPCCGGGKPVNVNSSRPRGRTMGTKTMSTLADLGTPVRLEYTGQAMSKTYTGQATAQRYRFGADRALGYVYPDDLQQFLELREKGVEVFKQVEAAPASEPTVATVADTMQADVDISDKTIAEIKEMKTTRAQWEMMLSEEKAGRNRAGVVSYITKKLS